MSIEEDKALVRRFYAEIDAGNIDAMDELVAEDYVDDKSASISGLPAGREGLKQAFRIFWEATPGRHEIEDQIAQGDKVVATRAIRLGRARRPGAAARARCAARSRSSWCVRAMSSSYRSDSSAFSKTRERMPVTAAMSPLACSASWCSGSD